MVRRTIKNNTWQSRIKTLEIVNEVQNIYEKWKEREENFER